MTFDPNDPVLTPQQCEQHEANVEERAPRSADEANRPLILADEILGDSDENASTRNRFQVRPGVTRAENRDTTRVYQSRSWVDKSAEPYVSRAHKITPPPPHQSEPLPPDPTPRRSSLGEEFEPRRDVHTEVEDSLGHHKLSRERIAAAFRDGRPNEARKRLRRQVRDALLEIWANGGSAKLVADDLGCSRQKLYTLMDGAPRRKP